MKEFSSYVERTPLIDKLPLDTPMGVHVCPSTYCNFRCFYCKHTLDVNKENNKVGSLERAMMSMETFEKIVEQLKEFPRKVELLNFAWLGEPLMNTHIADMVALAKKESVANTVGIVTNGSLLNHDMSDRLIDAGLDRLRISLQGFTEEDYMEVSGYKLNMDEYIGNIKYFYEHKDHTQVYVKMMDTMLKTKEDEARFHQIYDGICDHINIEHLVPLHNELDISDRKDDFIVNYFGDTVIDNKICSYIFLNLMISPVAGVYPCADADAFLDENGVEHSMMYASLYDKTLYQIWNGEERAALLRRIINGHKDDNPICRECLFVKYHVAEEDRLDPYQDRLKEIFL